MVKLTDKQLKNKFKPIFSKTPEKYYPTKFIQEQGFTRNICSKCKKAFWATDKDRKICGDVECVGNVNLHEVKPIKNKLSYIEVWEKYSEFFNKRDYTLIKRYPVVARWNPTIDFTIASIAAFQPYVISGEVDPPHKKLVVPQFCLRFGDIDNVGITGSHHTGFVMIGQHVFLDKKEWNQEKLFQDIYDYIINVVGLDKNLLILHEDAWAGGSNYGPCMEFFSCGIELFNQVYMMFEHNEERDSELLVKVLDMGLGMERIAWFSQATPTIYDAVMPIVLENLKKKTGVKFDSELFKKFIPYSSLLNLDEVEDINKAWKNVSEKVGVSVSELKEKIEPMTALYSVAEHTRSLLVVITDGGLPSNTGGGYNLRVILRRAMNFIHKYEWNISLSQVAEWHAYELKKLFPELLENLKEVKEILDYETEKYYESLKRNKQVIQSLKDKSIDLNKLVELYDSQGILPEELAKVVNIEVPDNFYSLVAERHAKSEVKTQTKVESKIDLSGVTETKPLYYDDYTLNEFESVIIKIINNNVILDETAFYPTSGGQLHDLGKIGDVEIVKVFKQGKIIVHVVNNISTLTEKSLVHCVIDIDRRLQLTQHHTATHILNGAARMILGKHIWQAGAAKTLEKARLDITHYKQITPEELVAIEELANKIIKDNITIDSSLIPRKIAESKYGFRIYQGGAVPGKILRIVNIPGFDVEACGGTHLKTTSEASLIKILKTSKLQDGIVRIEFTAGMAATKVTEESLDVVEELKKILNCEEQQIPGRCLELFSKWKKVSKFRKKKQDVPSDLLELISAESFSGDVILESAKLLKTQKEHVLKTVKRFLDELK